MSVSERPASSFSSALGLRARLNLTIVLLLTLVVGATSTYFMSRHDADLRELMQSRSMIMRQSLANKGITLARNVALASERAIAVMDFLFLTEVIESTVGNDREIVYGIIMDSKRRALVHSSREKMNQILDDEAARYAAAQAETTTHELTIEEARVLEVVSPITVAGERWGTIRFGLSLWGLNREIEASERMIKSTIVGGVMTTLVSAAVLMLLGTILGTVASARVMRPVQQLLEGVRRIEEGRFDRRVEPSKIPEFSRLGGAFNDMTLAIRDRDEVLRQTNEELRSALEEAKEASRLKSEFVSNISHELRTPLNAIVNVPVSLLVDYKKFELYRCDACANDYQLEEGEAKPEEDVRCPDCGARMALREKLMMVGSTEEHKHFLERLEQSGRYLLEVVNDLLDFSKLDAGKMKLRFAELELGHLFKEIANTMDPLAEREGLAIQYSVLEAPLHMVGDPVKITQVLVNLLSNAIKHTPNGGRITVRAEAREEAGAEVVHLVVSDTGVGIPRDRLEDIFESFRQLDGSHTRKHGGTGIGLTISRKLVELHSGRIWAESVLGSGSDFHVVLPRRPPEPVDPEKDGGLVARFHGRS